jgi:putative transposase
MIHNPRWYRRAERRLKTARRRGRRRKQGNHRRRKAVQLLVTVHQQVRHQRRDLLQKAALQRVRQQL